jgi:hypothetical protein
LDQDNRSPDGEAIAAEVELEMESGLFRLRHAILAPAEYYVYLHPDDFSRVEAIVPRIVRDVQMCLNERIEKLNGQSRWHAAIKGTRALVEIPPGGWAVHIRASANGDVSSGELSIVSRLSLPAATRFGSGAGTTRIVQTVVSGTDRRTAIKHELNAESASAPHVPYLSYTDDQGSHVFRVVRDSISIGRGGPAHWVDVAVITGPKVSREHCRIRRDAGRYFIQDFSTWGTFVNGKRIPKHDDAGPAGPTGGPAEQELADGASIGLGDTVVIDFHVT